MVRYLLYRLPFQSCLKDDQKQYNALNQVVALTDRLADYYRQSNLFTRTFTGSQGYWTWTYDHENQLTSVATDTYYTPEASRWKVEFVYDGQGRLRIRRNYTWYNGAWYGSGGETRYLYDGLLLVQERDSANWPLVTYTRGRDLSGTVAGAGGIGRLLARSHGYSEGNWSSHNFYHADGNGNVTALVNSGGTLQASYKYDPYGRYLSGGGSLTSANVMRFSSKPWVAFAGSTTSGLYSYGYRFYDPYLQRWPNRDPIHELGHQTLLRKRSSRIGPGDANLYLFVYNNPITKVDPDGRNPIVGGGIIGGIGIGLGYCLDRVACRARVAAALYNGEQEADRVAPDGSTHRGATAVQGGDADALTHCIAACYLGRHPYPCFGPDDALNRLQARETGNDIGTQLDRMNNETGIGIGYGLGPGQNCTDACLDALRRGLLNEIRNGQIVPSSVE